MLESRSIHQRNYEAEVTTQRIATTPATSQEFASGGGVRTLRIVVQYKVFFMVEDEALLD